MSDLEKAAKLHENVPPDWYYQSIKNNLLQRYWHRRRFEEIQKVTEKVEGKILDIGCADGIFTKVIFNKAKPSQLIAIDVLPSSVKWAKNHFKSNKKIKFQVGDAHHLKFNENTFDAVYALEVLEHVLRPKDVLLQIKKVLKKGGYAVFLVPSDSDLFNIVWWIWTKFKGKIWNDCHIQSYRNGYLTRLSKQAGFKIDVDKKFILGMLHLIKIRKV